MRLSYFQENLRDGLLSQSAPLLPGSSTLYRGASQWSAKPLPTCWRTATDAVMSRSGATLGGKTIPSLSHYAMRAILAPYAVNQP